MEAESTFDQLASQLSPEERCDLISKINASVTCNQEPIADLPVQQEEMDLGRIFHSLGFFKRLFILIKALFSTKEWNGILEDLVDRPSLHFGISWTYRTVKIHSIDA